GVSKAGYEARFGEPMENRFGMVIEQEKAKGMLEVIDGHLRLTKQALPLGNEVFARFLD
ncbi:MAG: oxygen-independent coproporphyrinogen III oxidase, partial [Clostridia bacterium]